MGQSTTAYIFSLTLNWKRPQLDGTRPRVSWNWKIRIPSNNFLVSQFIVVGEPTDRCHIFNNSVVVAVLVLFLALLF